MFLQIRPASLHSVAAELRWLFPLITDTMQAGSVTRVTALTLDEA
jgi:hypothetical protein